MDKNINEIKLMKSKKNNLAILRNNKNAKALVKSVASMFMVDYEVALNWLVEADFKSLVTTSKFSKVDNEKHQ